MMNDKLYMAIDVGTTKVCTLIARVSSNAELEVVGTGVAPSRGMKKGLVVDLGAMQESVRDSLKMASWDLDRELPKACVGVTGTHIISEHSSSSLNNGHGDQTISLKEKEQVIRQSHPKVAHDQELLHVIPQSYHVDGLQGIRNPVGLSGKKLVVESHAIIGEAASMDNVVRAVEGADISVGSMVLEPLASAEAVLTGDEKEMGVVLVDIGGGTTDIAIFSDGVMCNTSVLPVGGFQFTNDLVIAYGIPYHIAEDAKLQGGHALPDEVDVEEWVEVEGYDEGMPYRIRRRELCGTLSDRASELLRLILLKVREAGLDAMPPAGVVFTGGASNLPGWLELAGEFIPGPMRIAAPTGLLGLPEDLQSPTYSTSVGILLWGIRHPVEQESYGRQRRNESFKKGRHWLRWLSKFIGTKD
ncbi:MAG: cell division protein FtsA [Chloroflexi bacterium]|nr:cell division protein FtsA [Chloroflexota bacterium]MCZ6891299.1 cell division protein FtsA [Chloroflexota bacterium]